MPKLAWTDAPTGVGRHYARLREQPDDTLIVMLVDPADWPERGDYEFLFIGTPDALMRADAALEHYGDVEEGMERYAYDPEIARTALAGLRGDA